METSVFIQWVQVALRLSGWSEMDRRTDLRIKKEEWPRDVHWIMLEKERRVDRDRKISKSLISRKDRSWYILDLAKGRRAKSVNIEEAQGHLHPTKAIATTPTMLFGRAIRHTWSGILTILLRWHSSGNFPPSLPVCAQADSAFWTFQRITVRADNASVQLDRTRYARAAPDVRAYARLMRRA